mmetsp:Transcript_16457/g.42431  ORF Transcript_16457/g.42431 Transcript_16457/m.42431 type:complete len:415 (+) Transcript_16457:689-1933(+)
MLPSWTLPSLPLRTRRLAMALQILPSRAATNLLDTLPLTPTLGPRGPKATSRAQASSSRAQTLVMAQRSLTVAAASMQTSDRRVQRSWTWARATMTMLPPTSRRGPPTSLRSKPAIALPTSWHVQAQSQRATAPRLMLHSRQRLRQIKFTPGTRTTTTTTATTSSVVPKLRLAIRARLAKSLVMLLPLFLPLRRTMTTTTTTTTSADSLELQPRSLLLHRRTPHRSLPPGPALVLVATASAAATTTMTTSGNLGRPLQPSRLLLPRARAAALGTKMRRTRTGALRARARRLFLRHHSRPPCPRHRPLCLSSRDLLSSCLPRQRLVQMRGARRRGGEICAVTSYRCSRPRRATPRTWSPTALQIGTSGFSETPAFQRRPGSSSHRACRTWSCQRYPSWRWACLRRTSGPSSRVPA